MSAGADPAPLIAALADQTRLRLYDTLREAHRGLTVAELSMASGVPRAGVPRRMSTLSTAGLASLSRGRWHALQPRIGIPDPDTLPAGPLRDNVLQMRRLMSSRRISRLQAWPKTRSAPEWAAWRDATIDGETVLHATADDLAQIERRIWEVVREERARIAASAPREETEPVYLTVFAAPIRAVD